MKISIIFFLYVLSGIGYFYLGLSRLKKSQSLCESKPYQLTVIPSIGFAIAYSIYCLIYFGVIFFGNGSLLMATYLAIGFALIGLILLVRAWASSGKQISRFLGLSTSTKQASLCLLLLLFLIVLPQVLLGSTPFLVTDSWSHVSIINRMLDTKIVYLSSFSMPNDHYLLKYSPHHAFLASMAYLTDSSALEVFRAARYFYPIILVSAFLFCIQKIDRRYKTGLSVIALAIVIFSLTFPTTDAVWRGSADYRIPAFILMFLLIGLIYQAYTDREFCRPSDILLVAAGALCIAVTHVIEIAFLAVMLVPFGFFLSAKSKSKAIARVTFSILFILLLAALLGFLLSSAAYAPLTKSIPYSDFIKYYLMQLDTHIGFYTWGVAAVEVIFCNRFLRSADPKVSEFLLVTLISSLLLGPLNPALFPLYDHLMGSSHSNRIMLAFPFYFSLIFLISAAAHELCNRPDKKRMPFLVACVVLAVSAVGAHFYKVSGLNGEFTYTRNDSLSQLYLYPHFYNAIKQRYHHRVIVSDTHTSTPINAVSDNYVFTNRPWTGGQRDRFALAGEVMKSPATPKSIQIICEYGIDVIAINDNAPPEELKETFRTLPWLQASFQSVVTRSELAGIAGFNYYDTIDKIDIFEVDRNALCK